MHHFGVIVLVLFLESVGETAVALMDSSGVWGTWDKKNLAVKAAVSKSGLRGVHLESGHRPR